jgi:hypothetical protein
MRIVSDPARHNLTADEARPRTTAVTAGAVARFGGMKTLHPLIRYSMSLAVAVLSGGSGPCDDLRKAMVDKWKTFWKEWQKDGLLPPGGKI